MKPQIPKEEKLTHKELIRRGPLTMLGGRYISCHIDDFKNITIETVVSNSSDCLIFFLDKDLNEIDVEYQPQGEAMTYEIPDGVIHVHIFSDLDVNGNDFSNIELDFANLENLKALIEDQRGNS